jgi:hypothetical protein
MTPKDEVWNRACAEAGRPKTLTLAGDRALADMVRLHSLAMNSGLLDAIERQSVAERVAALDGYRFFGLHAAADVVQDIGRRLDNGALTSEEADELEAEADARYDAVVADDDVLVRAFEARYDEDASLFAPIE